MKLRFRTQTRMAGLVASLALVMLLAMPAAATTPRAGQVGNYRGQCRQLTKQIAHFEGTILPMAIARGNRMWEKATNEQVKRLWNRRADLCPAYGAERTFLVKARDEIRKFNKLVATAARGAAAFFSGGLTGGIGP